MENHKKNTQTNTNNKKNMTTLIVDFFKSFLKYWWIVASATVVFGIIGWVLGSVFLTPMYKSELSFTVSTKNDSDVYSYEFQARTASTMATTFPYILDNPVTNELLCRDLQVKKINGKITATPIDNTNMFTLSVVSNDPQDAYDILMSVVDNYPIVAEYVIGDTVLNILSPASVPESPYNLLTNTIIKFSGALLGFALGVAIIFIIALVRKTIKTSDDIKIKLNKKCIAIIPQLSIRNSDTLVSFVDENVKQNFKEAIRTLKMRVLRTATRNNMKVIMVTSSMSGEGKTMISLNLALSLAQHGKKVVLFDGDFKKDSLSKKLGLDPDKDLIDVSEIVSGASTKVRLHKFKDTGMYVFTTKILTEETVSVVSSARLKQLIETLRDSADYVIVDSPACSHITDALSLASCVDGIVFAVKQDYADANTIIKSIDDVSFTGVPILGVVLNNVLPGFLGYGYGSYLSRYSRYKYFKRYEGKTSYFDSVADDNEEIGEVFLPRSSFEE
ncbi:MAG: P-loop NTPase [bacterium]|nr:P-loop NTPase [bacterium]